MTSFKFKRFSGRFNWLTAPFFKSRERMHGSFLQFSLPSLVQKNRSPAKKALRAFPEGVRLACTRNGQPSTCSYINCHSGSADARAAYRTWSHGCLTLPGGAYYDEWQRLVYREIAVCQQEVVDDFRLIDVVLIENKLIGGRQQLVDDRGNRIF